MKRGMALFILPPLLILAGFLIYRQVSAGTPLIVKTAGLPTTLSGIVYDPEGPIAGVTVQVQGTANKAITAKDGSFTLAGINWKKPVTLIAYSTTRYFYPGEVKLDPKAKDWQGVPESIEINLQPLFETDNYKYTWFTADGKTGSESCAGCHREYEEAKRDAHTQAGQNPRFLTMYTGADVNGNKSPMTTFGSNGAALPPDPTKPYYGPGYKLDEPARTGNCAACHTPVAAKISNEKNCGWSGCHTNLTSERAGTNIMDPGVSPLYLMEDVAEGITCEFCHKIGGVKLDPETKLPPADSPGILSLRLYRPEGDKQVFFGTYGDTGGHDVYSELYSRSEYCAPCHYGVFGGVVGDQQVSGGVVIYNSYGEWLDSPYSDPETGKTCQDCHMPVVDTNISVFPEKGGIQRDYIDLHNHTMPGAADEQFLQNSVTMKSKSQRNGSTLELEVSITNDQTGHHIPTDSPMRQMILVVQAQDAAGNPLALRSGPVLPDYTGNFAGRPGKSYAKILRDEWTGETPTAAYWRPVTIAEDTRLAALATDTTKYTFDLPAGSTAQVKVQLYFRRAFQKLAEQKGWDDPDILMEENTIRVEK